METLPPCLFDAWTLPKTGSRLEGLEGWTASSLAESFVKAQLDSFYKSSKTPQAQTPSLSHIATGRILDLLQSSKDIDTDVETIVHNLSVPVLRQILNDPRTPYRVLRTFDEVHRVFSGGVGLVDIDAAVQQNEQYFRSQGHMNDHGQNLVGLEYLCKILSRNQIGSPPDKSDSTADGKKLTFRRQIPPKGGLEVLDYRRPRQLSINADDQTFCQVFDRITHGILRGLNWNNIILAGGMALTTLLHVDSSKDDLKTVKDPDLDMYIYGLGPKDANRKAEEIHDTWARNLPTSAGERIVVKNPRTISLITTYPNRRVQIVLKLAPNPTAILTNIDLDACALGFDGSHVLMLPRFARAIETGYSVFTMDLVWGHHLGNRKASQDSRIFKYADRGFGIRFMSSYVQSMEQVGVEAEYLAQSPSASELVERQDQMETWLCRRKGERMPSGSEPGSKTLRRIAYLGRDYVNRYYFGPPLAERSNVADEHARYIPENSDPAESSGTPRIRPTISLSKLDTQGGSHGLPSDRRGLGNLEIFIRYCEAWLLDAAGKARLSLNARSSLDYNLDSYDDTPTYCWNETFHPYKLGSEIQGRNDYLWSGVKGIICHKLGIPLRRFGYANYSTRRIRRQVHGPDFKSVQEKQITIPVIIPWALENYLLSELPQKYEDVPDYYVTSSKSLIPVHDSTNWDPSTTGIPSLRDTVSEQGNLRYWVITNESMWANEHRVLDEFAELMWCLSRRCQHLMTLSTVGGPNPPLNTDDASCCSDLARLFRNRFILPAKFDHQPYQSGMASDQLSLREALLFRSWAMDSPAALTDESLSDDDEQVSSDQDGSDDERQDRERHKAFVDQFVSRPPPADGLFWDPLDEGSWGEEGVPQWTDYDNDG